MKNTKIENRFYGIILFLLIAVNALVWSGVHANSHSAGHADELSDHYEELIVKMDDSNKRTLMTKLYTMDTFLDITADIFDNNKFPEGVTAMVSFDGDGMGKKNEEYGSTATDRLCDGFADVVKRHFPDSDVNIVTNVGEKSDEFYMLLMGRPSKEALIKEIEEFQDAMRAVRVLADDGREVSGTVSIGIAIKKDGQAFDSLFDEADQAAYEAKEAGKDCYFVSE